MNHFTAHRLMIHVEVVEPVLLNAHKGSAIRGALFHALRNRFCTMRNQVAGCADCPLWEACPVCTLVSTMDPQARLGRDAPRPFTIQPPLDVRKIRYEPGQSFSFGLTLYADALRLFPYVIMALRQFEEGGIGRRLPENGWRRGRLRIRQVVAENPLSGVAQPVLQEGANLVHMPQWPITHEQVMALAAMQPATGPLTLRLLTPTRITHRKRLLKPGEVAFRPFLGRLLDRLESLAAHFCDTPLEIDFRALVRAAEGVRTVDDHSQWVELRSYSTRQRRDTPIGGLAGQITFFADDWCPFMPWMVWGQFVHVGKDAVKGNGWYRIEEEKRDGHRP